MNSAPPAVVVLLLQWSLLLAVGWGLQGWLRDHHPRWRLTLWRSMLCFGVALPVAGLLHVPRWNIPSPRFAAAPRLRGDAGVAAAPVGVRSGAARESGLRPVSSPPERARGLTDSVMPVADPPVRRNAVGRIAWSWQTWLGVIWVAGVGAEAVRLWRLQLQLRRVKRGAVAAGSSVQTLAWRIRDELKIHREVDVRVSEGIVSPFLCGVFEPTILLPRRLADDLPADELNALLGHEMAHQRRHDLAWCIAWRLMKAVYWFHPLVWKIPDAHVLACEEEADRIAAARTSMGGGYARLLAQLALRVLRVPAAESRLALTATSHLGRRLIQLGRERAAAWRLTHSVTGLVVALGMLTLTAGWQFGQTPRGAEGPAQVATGSVVVTVLDDAKRPVAGAVITPTGLRVHGAEVSHYGWRPPVHGAVVKVVTDGEGKAMIRYPLAVLPEEKLMTGEISFSVEHAEFASLRSSSFPVDGTAKPVVLTRGIPIRVAGYFGANHERVAEIAPKVIGESSGVRLEDWSPVAQGGLQWRRMSSGKHFLHLTGRRASGEIVYSDGVAFFGEQREAHDYLLEMKPGLRVEGRLDAKVPRPVKNAWVQLSVHSDEANTADQQMRQLFAVRSGNTGFWFTYRPVAADGSFVFESVPDGDQIMVLALGDGFISANGVEVPPQPPQPGTPARRPTRGMPQTFDPVRPLTTIEVVTERTATITIVAKASGRPVSGAKISVSPNVIQMPTGSAIFGWAVNSSEEPFRELPPMPKRDYSAVTDEKGEAVLRNIPAFTPYFGLQHAQFELPLNQPKETETSRASRFRSLPGREVGLTLSPGQSIQLEVELQPKGTEFAGDKP